MNKPIKIAVDATALVKNRTGVGNYIFLILEGLVKNYNHQFILYSNQEIFFPDYSNVKKIVHTPFRKGPAWQNTQLIFSLYQDKPDIFWGGNGYLPFIAPSETKMLLTIHDLVYKYASDTMPTLSRWSRAVFQPLSVRRADSIVAVSAATANQMKIDYAREPNVVVHPQIDTQFSIESKLDFEEIGTKYGLSEYLLTIGTLEPRKNMAMLIESYLEVIDSGYSLPQLAIAGGKGWMQGELDRLVDVGVNKGVIKKLGYVPDAELSALYANASTFILASAYEGFGMPVLEAQSCGCPVLISNIESMREAANDICCTFEPTKISLKNSLIKLATGTLPLVCRLPVTITNDAQLASQKYLHLMESF